MENKTINVSNSYFEGINLDDISRRYSCRSFDPDKKISETQISQICAMIEKLNKFSPNIVFHFRTLEPNDKSPLKSIFFVPIYKNASGFASIEIKSAPEENRPEVDILIGILGEIFVLYLYSIGVANVWLGGAGFFFSPKKCAEILDLKESGSSFPICFAMGISKQELTDLTSSRKRKSPQKILDSTFNLNPYGDINDKIATIDDITTYKKLGDFLQIIQSAPSALNKQPYKIAFSNSSKKLALIEPDRSDYKTGGAFLTKWLDCGIAAAHFYVYHLQGKPHPHAQVKLHIKTNALILEYIENGKADDVEEINAN